ncbi:MAG TPA: VWA domain-containing protein [Saprospiraceae bacterium]|nr:VWA domain-containing protein [Saprospiraceae bacterium]
MIGYRFSAYVASPDDSNPFEKLLRVFKELILYTSGDVAEALSWLTELDKEYKMTTNDYGIADFIQDLIDKGYLLKPNGTGGGFTPSSKMEKELRRKALDDIFGKIKKSKRGNHSTQIAGKGDEYSADQKPYEFGDRLEQIAVSESIKNAHIQHGIEDFYLAENDLVLQESFYQSQMSTVVMIDISHSMILYGEDRITPAKKVAMALAELIKTKYPKDSLDIIVFGNDAWQIELKDLPYLEVGPYHTNTVAGLELAMQILRRRNNPNKQIFMITDGKPTCIKKGTKYYQNSFGLDRMIVNRTINLGIKCRKMDIPVTTFMIATDPYLVKFVEQFTKANNGKAFYSSLDGLGQFFLNDYLQNKKRKK